MPVRLVLAAVALAIATSASAEVRIPEACRQYQRLLTAEARNLFGLDAPVATLAAQVHQESRCNSEARSPVGAEGLTQFMPATAEDLAKRYPRTLGPAAPHDPRWAIGAQVRYMRDLMRARAEREARAQLAAAPGVVLPTLSECATWWFGLRDYNGGSGWTERDRRAARAAGIDAGDPLAVEPFNAGRRASAHHENTTYPRRILLTLSPAYTAAAWGRSVDCPGAPTIAGEPAMPNETANAAGAPAEHILQFFAFEHLPPHLWAVSRPFCDLAAHLVETLPRNPERTVALRKLLEGKDAAVRASLAR